MTRPVPQAVSASGEGFFRRWVVENTWLAERRDLLARWLDDETDREEIAAALGVPLGVLLRAFNDTAAVSAPTGFGFRGYRFAVTGMAGVCDDIVGDRFPRFGAPMTLRCYLAGESALPNEMFELADWNFMDAGRPGFLGYLYGVVFADRLWLAGLQSDLAARYSYLFQGRTGSTDVRVGNEVTHRSAAELVGRYGPYVPVLRRTFQRCWIDVLLAAALTWAAADRPDLSGLGLLQFDLKPEEDVSGRAVHRAYRALPDRLDWSRCTVRVGAADHAYRTTSFEELRAHLTPRYTD